MGMGWKEIKEEFEQEKAKERAKMEAKKQAKMEVNPPKAPLTEQERLAKRGNILLTGFSIWFLIPFVAVALIIGLVAVVGVYDWIFG
jgi:hypothetical protein